MKILILCDVLFPQITGGAGRVARELSIALRKLGNEVQFLTRRTAKIPLVDDIKTTYTPSLGGVLSGQQRKIFREIIEQFDPDIVHIHQPLPAFLSIPPPFHRVHCLHFSFLLARGSQDQVIAHTEDGAPDDGSFSVPDRKTDSFSCRCYSRFERIFQS